MNKDLHPTLTCALASNFPFPCRPHLSNKPATPSPIYVVYTPFNLLTCHTAPPPHIFPWRVDPNALHVKFVALQANQSQFSIVACVAPTPTPVASGLLQYRSLFCTLCPRPKKVSSNWDLQICY